MQSKNTADYTDFNGRTFKKIVQAPGGTSTFSLGWGNDKTDYGLQKTRKRNEPFGNKPAQKDFNKANLVNNEPIKVMEYNGFQQSSFAKKEPNNFQDAYKRAPLSPLQATNTRTCVKIQPQKSNLVLGDDNYNYWQELRKQKAVEDKRSKQSNNRIQQQKVNDKTSIGLKKSPGGRSTFTFG